jgi:hypothetical protein
MKNTNYYLLFNTYAKLAYTTRIKINYRKGTKNNFIFCREWVLYPVPPPAMGRTRWRRRKRRNIKTDVMRRRKRRIGRKRQGKMTT